jgi:hypothetical protein
LQKPTLTVPQFARAIGVCDEVAREIVYGGQVPSILVGKRRRVDARWVEQWLNSANPAIKPPKHAAAR